MRLRRNDIVLFYRIYSEEDYKELERYSTPELQRVPLDSSLLQMIAMGLPDARKFPFIEPPPADSIENAILSLKDHVSILDLAFFSLQRGLNNNILIRVHSRIMKKLRASVKPWHGYLLILQ